VDESGAFLSGSITASAGTIGGWNINQTNLSSSGIVLQSSYDEDSYISIGQGN